MICGVKNSSHVHVFHWAFHCLAQSHQNFQKSKTKMGGGGKTIHTPISTHAGLYKPRIHRQRPEFGGWLIPVLLGLGTRTSTMAVRIVLFTLRLLTRSIILSVITLMGLLSNWWSSVDYKRQERNVMSAKNVCYAKRLLVFINRSRRAAAEEALTMQTCISLLAENEGSQVMDTECSKEKFFMMYKRLSCLHTFSTVEP